MLAGPFIDPRLIPLLTQEELQSVSAPLALVLSQWPKGPSSRQIGLRDAQRGDRTGLQVLIGNAYRAWGRNTVLNRGSWRFDSYPCIHDPAALAWGKDKDRIRVEFAEFANHFDKLSNTEQDLLSRVQIYGYLITDSIAPTRTSACH